MDEELSRKNKIHGPHNPTRYYKETVKSARISPFSSFSYSFDSRDFCLLLLYKSIVLSAAYGVGWP